MIRLASRPAGRFTSASSVTADRRRTRSAVVIATVGLAVGLAVVLLAGLPFKTPASGEPRTAAPKAVVAKRPSLHAAPAGDASSLNADVARRLPPALAKEVIPDGRPGIVIFLKAECECSKGFAVTATALAPHLRRVAACTAVIEGTAADADAFAAATGLAIPFIVQPESELAREWGVQKAGCFALVAADGSVEAVWPGISRQGFRDLAGRLGVEPPLPENLLAEVPGAATAGCPLDYVSLRPAGASLRAPGPVSFTEMPR